MRLVCHKQKHRTLTSELIVQCGLFADMGSSPALTEFRARGKGLDPRTLTPVMVLDTDSKHLSVHSLKELEHLNIRDIMQPDLYPPVRITVTMRELVNSAMNQNFIPVVDDLGSFIGIVTRQDIIRFLAQQPHPQKDGPT